MKKSLFLLLLVVSTTFTSCFKDNDDSISPATTAQINDFIWRGLNYYYLYKADTPELANDAFASNNDYQDFLKSYDTPENFFDYLKSDQDRFSILVDDYIALENALGGTTLNNGMEYGLVRYPDNSGNVFGYVRYVLPNTSAENNGMTRGMIFNTVGGQQITENNFSELLAPDNYSIGLATFDGQTITPTGESIGLNKTEVTENPIHIARTLDINGQKIGYLLYNAFTNEFDNQLNAVFAQFQADGVTDLVLDLRYNGGGSVRTATYLSGMITGQFTGNTFYFEQWNEDRQNLAEEGVFLDSFVGGGAPLNSLFLNRVYVLTSKRTASASELVINGLDPYMTVLQIGDYTTGKYQASFLLYDAPAPNFRRSEASQNHTYAMLPLVFQTSNANGITNFEDGLMPDLELLEDYANLGQLGDPSEPLLAAAIEDITGIPRPQGRGTVAALETVGESKEMLPTHQIMYLEQ